MTRLAILAVATSALSLPLSAQYSVSSAVGPFPVPSGAPTDTGGGVGVVWPATMPSGGNMNSIPLATPVPANASSITRVVFNNLVHSWSGDLHFVLLAPSGARYDVVHRPNYLNTSTFGQSCDYNGLYTIVDPAAAGSLTWPANSTACTGAAILPPGQYAQYYGGVPGGTWPSGTNGIVNVDFNAIAIEPGIWTLEIYDWAGGDSGSIDSWRLEGDTGGAPSTYCTAGTSTNGCVPAISGSAQPSVSLANACVISVASLEGQKSGLIFYGINNSGFTPTPWSATSTSFLCVKAPTQRTGTQNTGGTAGACDGTMTLDWNAYQSANPAALGNPWSVGDKAFVQAWYRDPPAPKTTNLSDGLEMTYAP